MRLDDTEKYILQTLYGIIPKDLWESSKPFPKEIFKSFSSEEERDVKRKFRKLKRKSGVKPYDSSKVVWIKIDRFLAKNRL